MVLQGILLVLIGAAGVWGPAWPRSVAWIGVVLGLVAGVAGAGLAGAGVLRLGSSLTPFPRPVEGGALQEHGVYRLVRHPIYGGVLLLSLAWGLFTSPVALVPVSALAAVFEGKRRREEAWLAETYSGYADYRARVRRAFVPGIW